MIIDLDLYRNEKTFFFPIRHHSLISSKNLKIALENFNPDVILIEGPSDATNSIENIAKSKMPVSIYGLIETEKDQVGVNFPFLETSPEFVALKYGYENNILTEFIDLPIYDIETIRYEKINYEYNSYIEKIVEDSGLSCFDEYYEKYFEISLQNKSVDDYLNLMLTYCKITREISPSNDYNDLRENYMAKNIQKYLDKKVFIVTGGFHTPSLVSLIKKEISLKEKEINSKVKNNINYVIPYDIKNISSLNGYSAGISFPYYSSTLLKNKLDVLDTFTEVLSSYSRDRKLDISLPKIISGIDLAFGLARLREKLHPGVFELIDAAISISTNFTQYEDQDLIEENFKSFLVGDGFGEVFDLNSLPPLISDFDLHIKKYSMENKSEITLNVLSSKTAFNKSVFLARLEFLDIKYSTLVRGFSLYDLKIKDYVTQKFTLSNKNNVIQDLISASYLGTTISIATESKIRNMLSLSKTLEENLEILTFAIVLQSFNIISEIIDRIKISLLEEHSAVVTSKSLNKIIDLILYYRTFSLEENEELNILLDDYYKKFILQMDTLEEISHTVEKEMAIAINNIFKFINSYKLLDINLFVEILYKLKSLHWTTSLKGISLSILYLLEKISEETLLNQLKNNFVTSGLNIYGTAYFLEFLVISNKQLLLNNDNFLNILNDFFKNINEKDFLKLLPDMRRIFTSLRPTETITLSKNISRINSSNEKILVKYNVSYENIIKNKELEISVIDSLKKRGIEYGNN